MAYRAPTSSICLLKGCPCDSEYNNSVWYTSRQEQFNGNGTNKGLLRLCEHVWFTNQSYQRKGKNTLRINVSVANFENYLEYNYLIFGNTALTDNSTITKASGLFYCFLDTIEYINENCIEVTYSIDLIQTYMFDYQLGNCFVEREHTDSDNLYEHLEAEPFNPQSFYYRLAGNYSHSADLSVMIKYVPNSHVITDWYYVGSGASRTMVFNTSSGSISTRGWIKNKTYTGTCTVSFPIYFTSDAYVEAAAVWINTCLSTLGGTTDITEILILPSVLCPHATTVDSNNVTHYWESFQDRIPDGRTYSHNSTKTITQVSDFIDAKNNSYTPKNKKLFSAPYNVLYLTNEQGETKEVLWENFTNTSALFDEVGVTFGTPEIALIPKDYNGKSSALENAISLQNFPSCSFSFDTAKTYWEQNKAQITSNLIKGALLVAMGVTLPTLTMPTVAATSTAMVASTATPFVNNVLSGVPYYGNPPDMPLPTIQGGGMSYKGIYGASSLGNTIASLIDLQKATDKAQGTQTYSQVPVLNDSFGIKVYYKQIKPYEAKIIDSYFSLFGYTCKKVKVPNLYTSTGTKRPYWYYLKNAYTRIDPHVNSTTTLIDGYVNDEVDSALQAIYNKGITFWFDSADVGDYSLDNSPITT